MTTEPNPARILAERRKPEALIEAGAELLLRYRVSPGAAADGVTLYLFHLDHGYRLLLDTGVYSCERRVVLDVDPSLFVDGVGRIAHKWVSDQRQRHHDANQPKLPNLGGK